MSLFIMSCPEKNETFETTKNEEMKNEILQQANWLFEHSLLPFFEMQNETHILIDYISDHDLMINGPISLFLSGKANTTIDHTEDFDVKKNHINILNYALIYCDFIEEQHFGDITAPILRCINMKVSDQDIITYYDNPIYLRVKKSILNNINIQILDLQGNLIKFNDIFAFVILTLHFRKNNATRWL